MCAGVNADVIRRRYDLTGIDDRDYQKAIFYEATGAVVGGIRIEAANGRKGDLLHLRYDRTDGRILLEEQNGIFWDELEFPLVVSGVGGIDSLEKLPDFLSFTVKGQTATLSLQKPAQEKDRPAYLSFVRQGRCNLAITGVKGGEFGIVIRDHGVLTAQIINWEHNTKVNIQARAHKGRPLNSFTIFQRRGETPFQCKAFGFAPWHKDKPRFNLPCRVGVKA